LEALESRVTSTPFLCSEGDGHLYPVSNAFLDVVNANNRKLYWSTFLVTSRTDKLAKS